MNRRDFTRGLLSLTALPALPLPSVAAAAPTASATASHMYFMGWYTARTKGACSAEMLVNELNVDPGVAQEIFGKLVANNTVSAPNALGISQAIDPLPGRIRPGAGMVKEKAKEVLEGAKERLGEMLEEDVDREQDLTNDDVSDSDVVSMESQPTRPA